jgi:hypothetical protein
MKRRKKKFSFLKFHSLKRRPQIAPLDSSLANARFYSSLALVMAGNLD